VPAAALISFLLLGIEELGLQIEEPFGILPIEAFCDGDPHPHPHPHPNPALTLPYP